MRHIGNLCNADKEKAGEKTDDGKHTGDPSACCKHISHGQGGPAVFYLSGRVRDRKDNGYKDCIFDRHSSAGVFRRSCNYFRHIGLFSAAVARVVRNTHRPSIYRDYRRQVGRSILLGLELLVAADIIRTVAIQPTLLSVGVLAGVVVIRTFLSFTLELEISGHWPWQKCLK